MFFGTAQQKRPLTDRHGAQMLTFQLFGGDEPQGHHEGDFLEVKKRRMKNLCRRSGEPPSETTWTHLGVLVLLQRQGLRRGWDVLWQEVRLGPWGAPSGGWGLRLDYDHLKAGEGLNMV